MSRFNASTISYWQRAIACAALGAAVLIPANGAHAQPAPRGAPIHGYVGVVLAGKDVAAVGRGPTINVPDVDVVAKNVQTGTQTAPVKTNAQGYFHTPAVPAGTYQICVSGTGYVNSCDPKTEVVVSSIRVLDHVVPIEPTPRAVWGTVWLADQITPCFWFHPAFDTHAVFTAKVSLVDSGGNVVSGPVSGNSLGQYVLPTSATPGAFRIRAVCEGKEGTEIVKLLDGPTHQDIIIRNSRPQIASLDLVKGPTGVRRANPGDTLRATVKATDLDGDDLHYRWTDDSGRALGLPDAPTVDWPLINGRAVNTLRVQVSDGKGGFAVARRSLRGGPDQILVAGTVFNRQTHVAVGGADLTLNGVPAQTDAAGRFQVRVPDAPRFVLNVNKSGFALSSRVYYGRNTNLQIPLDPVVKATVNARTGGPVTLTADDCRTRCAVDECTKRCQGKDCAAICRRRAELTLAFDPGALVDSQGKPFTGTATVEGFQYDTTLPNPIPGDQGATFQGKTVRLATFGAFYLQPRDPSGKPLQLAPNKKVAVSMPIEARFLATAPATIPFFLYEEDKGLWAEHGTLTRSGDRYNGAITHFSAFNADTQFAGSACVKVILDPDSFTLPVSLDATYVDPSNGTFNHNGTQATDNPVGIERMPPIVNFTLEIRDASNTTVLQTVTLYSGPPLDPVQFPDGLVSDPNFDACNGPFTVYSGFPTGPTYLEPVTGGSITDNSTDYQNATGAGSGGNRETFTQWLAHNEFPDSNDAHAIYFNNGDLKFGRDMHCKVTSFGTTACYVSNFGIVGTDDSVTALSDARSGATPAATVAMEYDPNPTDGTNVQFWAYKGDNSYFAKPGLDGQGGKPIPDMCLACHGGYYDSASKKVKNAVFLPFDLDSFLYDSQGDPQGVNAAAVQEQFRKLNSLVLSTHPDQLTGDGNNPFNQLMSVWYPGGINNVGSTFTFNTGATQIGNFSMHEPLYDNVVSKVCRTCHIARSSFDDWTNYSRMSMSAISIMNYACGSMPAMHQTSNFAMPHAEVPFKRFWQTSLGSTVATQLGFGSCPSH